MFDVESFAPKTSEADYVSILARDQVLDHNLFYTYLPDFPHLADDLLHQSLLAQV